MRTGQSDRRRASEGIEPKLFELLRRIGVELTRYHGGSLNGKDIKTVTDNASFVFDEWCEILIKMKRPNSLEDSEIREKCEQFKSVFLLWDGAFSVARTINPEGKDFALYRRFVNAAVDLHCGIGCNITHKVHLMWKHVEWQMKKLPGGLGDKMEDWVELMHQWGMRQRRRLRTVKDPYVCANARAKELRRDTDPNVVAYSAEVQDKAKGNMKEQKKLKETQKRRNG